MADPGIERFRHCDCRAGTVYYPLFSYLHRAVFGNVFAVGILWFLPLAYLWAISMLLPFDALTSIIADCTIYSAFALASITEWIAQHSFYYTIPTGDYVISHVSHADSTQQPLQPVFNIQAFQFRICTGIILFMVLLLVQSLKSHWQPLRIDFLATGQETALSKPRRDTRSC